MVIELATFCNSMVLPARGGETIRPRCPLPSGVSKSMTRALTFSRTVSSFRRSCGYSGVRLSNRILLRASSGDSKLTASILTSAKYFSPSCGGRTWPLMVSPVLRSNLRICDGRNVNVVRAGKVVVIRRAEKAVAVGQDFEHALGEDVAFFFALRLEDLEDQVLLAQTAGTGQDPKIGRSWSAR